ncbi:hypothetical protein [Aquimarina mytili]|uniref:Uncharacterized protein n=1 Tax=Aquimarina mytili TaxID=874423 RepID=A0A937D617_9FLAO|nr:hypothetical protein [Aquimarina mytili]MBL0683904.1 hypothetical protein [Aquimarina mytili]
MNTTKEIRFKTINKTTLAKAYGVPPRTIKLWLQPIEKQIGEYLGKNFNPKQVELIVSILGQPEDLDLITSAHTSKLI